MYDGYAWIKKGKPLPLKSSVDLSGSVVYVPGLDTMLVDANEETVSKSIKGL